MTVTTYQVQAQWDEDGETWLATSEDIPGLVTGGRDIDEVTRKVLLVAPHLVDTGVGPQDRVEVHVK